MTEIMFTNLVKKTIVDYWNASAAIVKKFGKITIHKPKVILVESKRGKYEALAKVHFDSGDYYFEVSWSGKKTNTIMFDVYKKQTKTHTVKLD